MEDDLDDLFGEGPALEIPVALPKGLIHRVDELCLGGCRQKIVWSRAGSLAYISTDQRSIVLQHLLCDHRDGKWKLSKPYPLDDVRVSHGGNELVHLSWSVQGQELAIVDLVGRISIYTVYFALNRMHSLRRGISDPEDTLSSPVSLMWFATERPDKQEISVGPMVKQEDNLWNFSCSLHRIAGPKVPRDRPGLITITRSGKARVLFQNLDQRWTDIKSDLQPVAEPSDLLTHAGICPDKSGDKKDGLLIVTHNMDRQVRLYRAKIDFGNLTIHTQAIKVLDNFAPLDDDLGNNIHDKMLWMSRLSYLDIIPFGPESKSRPTAQPLILAGFSYLADDFQAGGEQMTTVCRWGLEGSKSTLHPSFGSLSQKNLAANSDSSNEYTMRRLPDRQIPKTLLGIQPVNAGLVFALLFSDGTVEFRDRAEFEILVLDENERQMSGFPQIGFNFLGMGSCLHATLSPHAAALAAIDEHHSPVLSFIQFLRPLDADVMSGGFFERICEAFVLHLTCATISPWNCVEDLLYALQNFTSQYLIEAVPENSQILLSGRKAFNEHLLSEVQRVLGIPIDSLSNSQGDQVFKNQYFQRCLNLQSSLGYSGENYSRTLPASVAWVIQNLKYCSMIFTLTANKNPKAPPGALDSEGKNPETVHFLLGLVSWFMTLLAYLTDELFTLSDHFADINALDTLDAIQLNQRAQANPSPVLPLLLASSSRAILRMNCKLINHIATESKSIVASMSNQPQGALLNRAYRELDSILAKSLIDVSKADRLFGQIETAVTTTYQNATSANLLTPEDRSRMERDMLFRADIPELLVQGVVRSLLSTIVDSLKEEVNVAELFFADVAWLGLTLPPAPSNSDQSGKTSSSRRKRAKRKLKARRRPIVDIMRKVIIHPDLSTQSSTSHGDSRQRASNGRNNLQSSLPNGASNGTATSQAKISANSPPPLPRLRRCIRCCSIIEDNIPSRNVGMVVGGIQRNCLCGGHWVLLDGTEDLETAEEETKNRQNGMAANSMNLGIPGIGQVSSGATAQVSMGNSMATGNAGLGVL